MFFSGHHLPGLTAQFTDDFAGGLLIDTRWDVPRGSVPEVVSEVKKPSRGRAGGLFFGEPGGDLLSHTGCALSSARRRFTVLFGMGRGGSNVLWPPSITCPPALRADAK